MYDKDEPMLLEDKRPATGKSKRKVHKEDDDGDSNDGDECNSSLSYEQLRGWMSGANMTPPLRSMPEEGKDKRDEDKGVEEEGERKPSD